MSIQSRLDYVRKNWGDDVWVRTVGTFTHTGDIILHSYDPSTDLSYLIDRAQIIANRMRPDVRGERYVAWLAREIYRITKPAFKAERKLAQSSSIEDYDAATMAFQQANIAIEYLFVRWQFIRDWFIAHEPINVNPLTYRAAGEEAWRWHESLKKHGRYAIPAQILHEWPDGTTMQVLRTKAQLESEGEAMDHCVGGYWSDVRDRKSVILSLRDQGSVPHATIEVRLSRDVLDDPLDQDFWSSIEQAMGTGNEDVEPIWHPYIVEFLRIVERDRGRVFDDESIEAALYLFPVEDRLEKIWPAIDIACGRMLSWAEALEPEPEEWYELGFYGSIDAVEEHEDELERIEDEMPPAARRLSEDDQTEIRNAIAYAVYASKESTGWAREQNRTIETYCFTLRSDRRKILAQAGRPTPDISIRSLLSIMLSTLEELGAAQRGALSEAGEMPGMLEPDEVYWQADDLQDVDDVCLVFSRLMQL